MNNKNKQFKIEKGVLLFTQPRSPYFYGKLRVNGRYITKSFAPVEDYEKLTFSSFFFNHNIKACNL